MANYAIIRMEKFKISDVQRIKKHNQRQGKSKSNLDIDYERSHLNVDLLNEQNLQYERLIKDEISERVKRKPRANSVVLSEFLVTASPDYMQSLSEEEQKRAVTGFHQRTLRRAEHALCGHSSRRGQPHYKKRC